MSLQRLRTGHATLWFQATRTWIFCWVLDVILAVQEVLITVFVEARTIDITAHILDFTSLFKPNWVEILTSSDKLLMSKKVESPRGRDPPLTCFLCARHSERSWCGVARGGAHIREASRVQLGVCYSYGWTSCEFSVSMFPFARNTSVMFFGWSKKPTWRFQSWKKLSWFSVTVFPSGRDRSRSRRDRSRSVAVQGRRPRYPKKLRFGKRKNVSKNLLIPNSFLFKSICEGTERSVELLAPWLALELVLGLACKLACLLACLKFGRDSKNLLEHSKSRLHALLWGSTQIVPGNFPILPKLHSPGGALTAGSRGDPWITAMRTAVFITNPSPVLQLTSAKCM